jgi:hypothetical protein
MNYIQSTQPINYNDVFFQLQDYILNNTKIVDSTKNCVLMNKNLNQEQKQKQEQRHKQKQEQIQSSIFVPREKDSLFWCLYIMKHGQTEYNLQEHRNYIMEKKIKIDYVEQIRKDKQLMKTYKFATLTHLESNLANDDKIDVSTFLSLCVLENLNVVFVSKRTYFELLMNDGVEMHTIHSLDNRKHGYSSVATDKQNLLQIDNISKPLKSISAYKVQDLLDFCEKLQIKTDVKKKSKNELYESLVQYFGL